MAWVKGSQFTQHNGIYGTQGTAAVTNSPGARQQHTVFPPNANLRDLWMFGGTGFAATGFTATGLNDVWLLDLPSVPTVTTLAATDVSDTTVTLNASANPNGGLSKVRFQISTVSNLNGATVIEGASIGAGQAAVPVNLAITGLQPATIYYYAAEAISNPGNALGSILNFTTLSTIDAWRLANLGTTSNTGNAADLSDFDFDGVLNLFEFAFGTNPNNNASGPGVLVTTGGLAGGALVSTGQPITMFGPAPNGVDYRAVFIRRKDYVAAGLTYIPQFSANLTIYQNSMAIPTVLADDGTFQAVSVPYPPFIGGKKVRFFRMSISIAP